MNIQLLRSLGGLGGGGNSTPFTSDAFEIWDYRESEIITVGENKYFKGKNGHNLLITGYDFEAGWNKGFLYKSAATVSAPAGDTAFIAADLNNFFYATDGTPNQIPVISMFQNVDYAGRLFSKHYEQSVDYLTQVETYEPRVWQTVLYNTVKTDADLTKCNSYYSVPVEDLTAKWVDFNVAVTGTGTKASPYKTMTEARNAQVAGGIIYVKTGSVTNIDISAKSLKLVGVGYCRTTRTSASGIVICSNSECHGFSLATNSFFYCNGTSNGTFLVDKCRIGLNIANYSAWFKGDGYTVSVVVKNCVLPGKLMYSNCDLTIETSIINGTDKGTLYQSATHTANVNTLNYKHNRVNIPLNALSGNAGYVINNAFANMYIFDNEVRAENVMSLYTNIYTTIDRIEVTYNRYYGKSGYDGLAASGFITSEFDLCANNYINFTGSFITAIGVTTSYLNDSILIKNNIFDIYDGFALRMTAIISANTVEIDNNVLINKVATNQDNIHGISITPSNLALEYTFDLSIKNNLFLAPTVFGSEFGGHTMLFLDNVKHFTISKNKFYGAPLYSIIVKSHITAQTHEGSSISYNVITNKGLILRNISNALIANNVIVGGLELIEQEVGQKCKDDSIYNNIITPNSDGYFIKVPLSENIVSNKNVFDGSGIFNIYTGADRDFSQWQGLGFDINSLNQSANLTTGLWPTTPIIIGENLDATYENGLDISTNWGSVTTVPSVVTKKQTGTNWQVGAYVQ